MTAAPRYRLAVFDFDGTLADSLSFFLDAWGVLAREHGFREIPREELEALRGASAREMMGHAGVAAWKVPRIAMHFRRLMAERTAEIRLFPGIYEMLVALRARGMALAVLSSNSADNVRVVLGAAADAVSHYECGVALFGKRRRLRALLARSGVTANEAIAIGDELRDLDAARSCGVAFGAVSWGFTTRAALAARDPDFLFDTAADIDRAL